jgi:hypothetical protein
MAGALFGVGLAVALLVASRPGAAVTPAPASLRIEAVPTGELEMTPAPPRPVLLARGLHPGGPPARGSLLVRNQTGRGLTVALRVEADTTALDGLLRVRVRDGGRVLSDSTLEGLALRPPRLRLASGQRTRLGLETWLPRHVLSGYEGVRAEASLEPVLSEVGSSR